MSRLAPIFLGEPGVQSMLSYTCLAHNLDPHLDLARHWHRCRIAALWKRMAAAQPSCV